MASKALTAEDFAFSRLLSYIAYQWPGYRDAAHHRLICRKLEAVERGEIKRLVISVPPRHGKSLIASTYFPAWYLGRNPDKYVITATYGQDFADDFGRQVKNQIADPSFGAIFPGVSLASDSRSSRRFSVDGNTGGIEQTTNRQGAYYAVGVGGPLTGRGAHVLIVDDPIKNREDADSETIRRKMKDWFTSTAFTRLMPGGAVIVIQTRWHEDDLTGWLLSDHAAEGWDVIHLPALAEANDALGREPGEALWPEQYDEQALANIRRLVGPRDWSALYQQRPAPDTGDYFKRDWLIPVDVIPPTREMMIYGASDYAVTANGGDYTVHVVVGVASDGRLYLLDLWRAQASSDVWVDAFCALVRKWSPIGWAEETGQIKAGVGPFLVKRMLESGSYTVREQFPTRGDKAVRAQSIRGRMAMQGLHVPRTAPWLADLIAEMMSFPVGVHDDQVDALGLVGQLMDRMDLGTAPKSDQPKPGTKPKVVSDGVIAAPLRMPRR